MEINPSSIHEDAGSILDLAQWGPVIAVSHDLGHRHSLDLPLLWLWSRPAAAAPIQPLAFELPYAMGAAL